MNKRQAKKRRKKATCDLLNRSDVIGERYEKLTDAIEECYEKLSNMAEKIGQALNKWLESGMPFPKEGEKNENDN